MSLRAIEFEANRSASLSQIEGERLTLPGGSTVVLGVPPRKGKDTLFGGDELFFPVTPHIFTVSELRLGTANTLKGVVVLVAHGKRTSDNEWRFSNDQLVIPTVLQYNNFARVNGYAPVEAVFVCNGEIDQGDANRSRELVAEGVIFPMSGAILPHLTRNGERISLMVSARSPRGFANMS